MSLGTEPLGTQVLGDIPDEAAAEDEDVIFKNQLHAIQDGNIDIQTAAGLNGILVT